MVAGVGSEYGAVSEGSQLVDSRTSGVRVSFDTTNTCDSFYRASVDFVLNVCSRAPNHCTSVQIDGEDAWKFVAGLAENIRASIIVSAAVAARSRSRFLQEKYDNEFSHMDKGTDVILMVCSCAGRLINAYEKELWKFKVNMLKQNLNCQRYALCCGNFLPRSLLLRWSGSSRLGETFQSGTEVISVKYACRGL
uniref:Uncharacterized protein n=1 Tax=Quercus lobata TaxID=97700 RepID=A0A7N2RB24_QUELO